MKRIFSIAILQCAFIVSIFSQSPFGTISTKWTFEGWSEGSGWEPNWEGNCQGNKINYEVSSELVIDGITCGVITSNKANDSLIVYQDNGEVFFNEDSAFYKLFDFNASVGDTLISFRPSIADNHSLKDFFGGQVEEFSTIDTIYTLITDLDTTIINGEALKRWSTEPLYSEQSDTTPIRLYDVIIENIGSLNGLLGDHGLFIGEGCYGGFVCYESDEFSFGSYFFPLCDFTSSTGEIAQHKVRVYPNPTSDWLRVELGNFNVQSIELFNWAGQRMLQTKLLEIYMREFSSGMYVVKIVDDEGNIIVKKVVKQ